MTNTLEQQLLYLDERVSYAEAIDGGADAAPKARRHLNSAFQEFNRTSQRNDETKRRSTDEAVSAQLAAVRHYLSMVDGSDLGTPDGVRESCPSWLEKRLKRIDNEYDQIDARRLSQPLSKHQEIAQIAESVQVANLSPENLETFDMFVADLNADLNRFEVERAQLRARAISRVASQPRFNIPALCFFAIGATILIVFGGGLGVFLSVILFLATLIFVGGKNTDVQWGKPNPTIAYESTFDHFETALGAPATIHNAASGYYRLADDLYIASLDGAERESVLRSRDEQFAQDLAAWEAAEAARLEAIRIAEEARIEQERLAEIARAEQAQRDEEEKRYQDALRLERDKLRIEQQKIDLKKAELKVKKQREERLKKNR